jgi:isoprenylcysteine carboxyl methyltransferase (ICMT) family protein YpbQ
MPLSAYIQSAVFLIGAGMMLFASAGTFAIPAFWVYLAIMGAVFVASLTMLDPELMQERMHPGGQPPPVGLKIFTIVLFVHFIVAGLDRGRLHLSDTVPPWLQGIALAVLAATYVLVLWAMRVNRFFSSVVRIQSDRGQFVVTTGPYAVIRHPGYLAGNPGHGGERHRARLVARGCALDRHEPAVLTLPGHYRGPRSSRAIARLSRLCRPGSLAADSRPLVSRVSE